MALPATGKLASEAVWRAHYEAVIGGMPPIPYLLLSAARWGGEGHHAAPCARCLCRQAPPCCPRCEAGLVGRESCCCVEKDLSLQHAPRNEAPRPDHRLTSPTVDEETQEREPRGPKTQFVSPAAHPPWGETLRPCRSPPRAGRRRASGALGAVGLHGSRVKKGP